MGTSALTIGVAALVVHALDASAAAVEVAHDGAGEVVGDGDFDVHDGLEQGGLGGLHGFLEGDAAGHLEGEIVGIDVVIGAVVEDDPEIDYGKTGEVAASGGVFDSFFYCGDEVLGDGAAEDVVDEFEFSAAGQRLHLDFAIAVLAVSAGLFFVASLDVGFAANGFAIGNLGSFQIDLGVVALLRAWKLRLRCAADRFRR